MNIYDHQLEERPQISEPKNTKIPFEIDAYFNEKLSPPEVEPLAYWKNHTHFPILSIIDVSPRTLWIDPPFGARDYFAIQACKFWKDFFKGQARYYWDKNTFRLSSYWIIDVFKKLAKLLP